MNEFELFKKAKYFYNSGFNFHDYALKVAYYSKAVILYDKILKSTSNRDVRKFAFKSYYRLSHAQLFTGQYQEAIINAKRVLEIKDDIFIYINLALAYLLNNQYNEAISVITKYKDKKLYLSGPTFNNEVLIILSELEAAGIDHPDFEKVRQILEE